MLFLIEYDPTRGELITFSSFEDQQKRVVEEKRLSLEIDLNRQGKSHEVVILQADDEAAVRRTHRRYFEDLRDLIANGIAHLPVFG